MTRLLLLPAIFAIATISLWYMIISAPEWNDNVKLNESTHKKSLNLL